MRPMAIGSSTEVANISLRGMINLGAVVLLHKENQGELKEGTMTATSNPLSIRIDDSRGDTLVCVARFAGTSLSKKPALRGCKVCP